METIFHCHNDTEKNYRRERDEVIQYIILTAEAYRRRQSWIRSRADDQIAQLGDSFRNAYRSPLTIASTRTSMRTGSGITGSAPGKNRLSLWR
jgi:hypothetical protein